MEEFIEVSYLGTVLCKYGNSEGELRKVSEG